jgi:hypothetical protein
MSVLHDQLIASHVLEDLKAVSSHHYGFTPNMSFEEYCKIPAVNYSSLKHMKRSPLSYRYFKDHPVPPTDAMVLGNHTHRMILEPETVGDFALWGEVEGQNVRRGKVWDTFQAECALSQKQVITRQERAAMVNISTAVRKSPLAMRFLDGHISEVTMVWRDKRFDRDCKGRLDKTGRISAVPFIADLKTAKDCSKFSFGNAAYRLGYHIQLAMYREGFRTLTGEDPEMYEIAVENKPPYELTVFSIPDEVLAKGQEDYEFLMRKLCECERTDSWPPAEESITDLSLPSYAYGSDADDFNFSDLIAEEVNA